MKRLLLVVLVLSVGAFAQKGNGPTISISTPTNGASFSAPASISIAATASDPNATIREVQFFASGTLIGSAKTSPYKFVWSNVPAGSYSLTAQLLDSLNQSATSAAVNITVNAPPTGDFTISSSPTSVNLSQGGSSNATVTVASVNGFNSATSLSVSALPAGVTGAFVPSIVTPASGGSATSTLTLSASSTATPGVSTVTITGTAGTLSHNTSLSLTVTAINPPNYVGYVDHMGCDSIAGWAADRNRLNTSINIEIYDGTTLIQTVFANTSRPDVGSFLGDNGLHGYSIATPSRFMDGQAHQVHVKFETSTTELTNSPQTLTCSTGTGTIQGYKIDGNGAVFNSPGATITIDGTQSFGPAVNPYGSSVTAGSHTVTSSAPTGFSVSYSLCVNCTDHTAAGGHPFVAGTAVTVNVPASGYVDLWWKYTVNASSVNLSAAMADPANRTGGPDNEDLLSGNYYWNLPLVSLKGRAGMDLNLRLAYNSLVWTESGSQIFYDPDRGFPSPGFRLGFDVIQSQPYASTQKPGTQALLLITSSGRRVEVRQVGSSNLYESADSSYLQLFVNGSTATLKYPNGAVTQFQLVSEVGEYHVTQLEDANGNLINVNLDMTSGNKGRTQTITDTVGRIISFNYNGDGTLHSITQQPWSDGGTHTWVTFGYSSLPFSPSFAAGLTVVGPPSGTLTVLQSVTSADGSTTTLNPTVFGQVRDIHTLAPNGSQLSLLDYQPNVSSGQTDCPRFTQKTVFALNWPALPVRTFTITPGSGGQTTAAGVTRSETYNTSGFSRGLLSQSVVSGPQGSVTTTYTYTQSDTTLQYPQNPVESDVAITDGQNTRHTTALTFVTAGLPQSNTSILLAQDTMVSSDGTAATQLSKAHTDYNLTSAYLNANIIGIPSKVSTYDNNNTLLSQAENVYDGCLNATNAPIQHDPNRSASFSTRGLVCSLLRHDATNPGNTLATTYTYDVAGNLLSTADPLLHITQISYSDNFSDGIGRSTFAYPTRSADAEQFSAVFTYDYATGLLTLTHDPLGAEHRMDYDFTTGHLLRNTYHDSIAGVDGTYTRYVYPLSGTEVQTFNLVDAGDEVFSTKILDGAGNVIATARDFPGSTGGHSGQQFTYDAFGRLASASSPTEFSSSNISDPTTWTPTGASTGFLFTTHTYDYLGRPLVTTNQADGSTRSISYSGCGCAGGGSTTTADELGRTQQELYDGLGRSIQLSTFDFTGALYSQKTTTYSGLTTTVQMTGPGSSQILTTTMVDDGFGRLVSKHVPQQTAGKNTTFSYNPDGTVFSVTDARGAVATYSYNPCGLVTQVAFTKPDGHPAAGLTRTFTYDGAGNRKSMVDASGAVTYDYDAWSRLTDETKTFADIPGSPATLTYKRNLIGELTKIRDSFGDATIYGRDASGALTSVSGNGPDSAPVYISQYSYRPNGSPQQMQFGNGFTATFEYYPTQSLKHYVVTSGSLVAQNYRYSYTPDHLISGLQDNVAPLQQRDVTFTFDHLSRLSEAHAGQSVGQNCGSVNVITLAVPYCESFAYDIFGNATTSLTASSLTILNPVPFSTTATYTNNRNNAWQYDDDGRPLSQDLGLTNSYDAAGDLVTTVNPNGLTGAQFAAITINSTYDGDDALAKRTVTLQVPTYYLRSTPLGGSVVAEINGSGSKMTGFVYANGKLIARNDTSASSSPTGTFWVHRDPLTGSEFRTSTVAANINFQSSQLDPLGRTLGLADAGQFISGVIGYPDAGVVFDTSGGCTLDGGAIPCDEALGLLNGHSEAFTLIDMLHGAENPLPPPSKTPDVPESAAFDAFGGDEPDSSSGLEAPAVEYLALDTTNTDGDSNSNSDNKKGDHGKTIPWGTKGKDGLTTGGEVRVVNDDTPPPAGFSKAQLIWLTLSPMIRSRLGLYTADELKEMYKNNDPGGNAFTYGQGPLAGTYFVNHGDPAIQPLVGVFAPFRAGAFSSGDAPPSGVCVVFAVGCGWGMQATYTLNSDGLHLDNGEFTGNPQYGVGIGFTVRESDLHIDGLKQLMSDFGMRIEDGINGVRRFPSSLSDYLQQLFTFSPFGPSQH